VSKGEEPSGAVTVGKFMVPCNSRIARPDGVCKSCGSGLLASGVDVDVVEMFFDMCTGVTEGHVCVVIVSFYALLCVMSTSTMDVLRVGCYRPVVCVVVW